MTDEESRDRAVIVQPKSRRTFLGILAGIPAIAFSQTAYSQSGGPIKKVAWFGGQHASRENVDAFDNRLAELGWRNRQNTEIRLFRFSVAGSAPAAQRQKAQVAEIIAWQPDAILVTGARAATAVKESKTNIPVVFHLVADPIAAGLVTSLRQPGGSFTGVTTGESTLALKRLQIVRDLLPAARRIAAVYTLQNEPAFRGLLSEMKKASQSVGLELSQLGARAGETAEELVSRLRMTRAQAVMTVGELFLRGDPAHSMKVLLDYQMREKAPIVDNSLDTVDLGFALGVAELETDRLRRAADITAKILNGTSPAQIPVEEPTRIQVWINLKIVKALGISVSPLVHARADRVIQ